MRRIFERVAGIGLLVAVALAWAQPGAARVREGDPEYQDFKALEKEWQVGEFAPPAGRRPNRPADIPDIFGPGAVLSVGRVFMKCTNYGLDGNPFTAYSSDPSGQWPGASSVEYLNYVGIAVGAVNPFATDPLAVRRVSLTTEWRPPTLDPEDRMYRSYDGIVNGVRYKNDDGDSEPLSGEQRIDEEILDGRDNDGDGLIDEDFAALGQQMYTCVMRDDTPQAINAGGSERHVPLGLEMWKSNWAYSISGYMDFNVIQYDIYNRSGHTLDSVTIGFRTDMDCGPLETSGYWSDDENLPYYPHGDFLIQTSDKDKRLQPASDHTAVSGASSDSALCPRYKLRVQGWSCADDDGDTGKTPGIATVMLLDHTIDPTGTNGPSKVGIRAFRSFTGGTPYGDGGNPTIDQQRFEFMTSTENIDPLTGFISATTGEQKGDYSEYVSLGPWRNLADGGHLQATLAFGVSTGTWLLAQKYNLDYERAYNTTAGAVPDPTALTSKYPTLANALAAQIAFEGVYETRVWPWLTSSYGRETPVKAPPGQLLSLQDCRDQDGRPVNDRDFTWFDFDCDYCTGAYSKTLQTGFFHRTWLAGSPPPSPSSNMSASYNYSDNPNRQFVPAGDGQVTIAWDNLSETTPDPKTGEFDFRGYKLWKVSNWQRPVGAGGPFEDDWTLLAEYRLFDSRPTNAVGLCPPESIGPGKPCAAAGDTLWPRVFIPQTGTFRELRLYSGDIWDRQSGTVLRPDESVHCVGWPGDCQVSLGTPLGLGGGTRYPRTLYPVGRWHVTDRQVKNGFVYFYALSAFDSTSDGSLSSQRSAVEADGVVPQAIADTLRGGSRVWVVPNPYRGVRQIKDRPSAWDLIPNASDPTGTHVDFMGLPRGNWRIKIFTVSGDMVVELGAQDAVNESIRPPTTDAQGTVRPGYNRQQDNPNDGQARWNLISRNGQDVVSGIYLFTVELGGAVKHRGKFVIIR
jgi:hypothetical protein